MKQVDITYEPREIYVLYIITGATFIMEIYHYLQNLLPSDKMAAQKMKNDGEISNNPLPV